METNKAHRRTGLRDSLSETNFTCDGNVFLNPFGKMETCTSLRKHIGNIFIIILNVNMGTLIKIIIHMKNETTS